MSNVRRTAVAVAAWVAVGLAAARPGLAAAPPGGTFADDQVRLELTPDGTGGYVGQIQFKQQTFPATGRADGTAVRGQFVSNGQPFDFVAEPRDGGMTLTTGKKVFALAPVIGGAPAAAVAVSPSVRLTPPPLPAGYVVIRSTKAGRAVAVRKAGDQDLSAVLQSVLHDVFTGGYHVTGSTEDARDHRWAVAAVTARYAGRPVKAVLIGNRTDAGATVAISYCRADATRADWAELTDVSRPADLNAAVASIPLRKYDFADGTGFIGLPDGYQTNATTCTQGFSVIGPAGQAVVFSPGIVVNTPNSQAVAMARQYGTGGRPLFVAPQTDPVHALVTLTAQQDQMARQRGQAGQQIDGVRLLGAMQPLVANAQRAAVTFGLTAAPRPGGPPQHYQAYAEVEVDSVSAQAWTYTIWYAVAPTATYANDRAALLATMHSWRIVPAVVEGMTRQALDAQWKSYYAGRKAAAAAQPVYDDHPDHATSPRPDDPGVARSMDDFDEAIRGWRAVEDTNTGEKAYVDLGNVDQTVNNLNESDPGRYRQAPLRDELDPLP